MADRLALLLDAAERLTVDLLAQPPVCADLASDSPAYCLHIAEREGFDLLPVREQDGRIVRFVRRAALRQSSQWDGIHLEQIHPDEIVSASSPMLELLDRFAEERPLVFVLGSRGIESIATVFDLNQPAAHQFGFALSLIVEAELAQAVEDAVREDAAELDRDVDERIADAVCGLGAGYRRARRSAGLWSARVASNDQMRMMSFLGFNDKIGLVENMDLATTLAERCRSPYGTSADRFVTYLRDEVKELRNAVAHLGEGLVDERDLWRWMRTTFHVAQDLARR